MKSRKPPDPIDVLVGSRLRLARTLRRQTLAALAGELNVSPNQILNYENGVSRLPVSALVRLCGALGRPVTWFLADVSDTGGEPDAEPDVAQAWLSGPDGVRLAARVAQAPPPVRRRLLTIFWTLMPEAHNDLS